MVKKRLLVIGFAKPLQARFIHVLSRHLRLVPEYWIAGEDKDEKIIKQFAPDTIFQSKYNAISRIFPEKINRTEWPVEDPFVVQLLSKHDPTLMPVYYRESRQRTGGMDQINEYYQAITTWYHVFMNIKPEVVIFHQTPGHIYDYVIYLLCEIYSVPKIILLHTHLFPGICIPLTSIEKGPVTIENYYKSLCNDDKIENFELNKVINTFYNKMQGNYEDAVYSKFQKRYKLNSNTGLLDIQDTLFRKILKILSGKSKKVLSLELAMELRTWVSRYLLRTYYESRTVTPDYQKNYVFVALQVQPERTSLPLGGIYGFQMLMVDILSRALPDGWYLYIKEHPSQLYYRPHFSSFRSKKFYKDLASYRNVILIPSRIPSIKLIEHARAVASANSTASWEAIFRNVPSLVFGHAWYRSCEGVFYTPDYTSAKDALIKIRNGYRIDKDKVKAYIYSVQECSIPPISGQWVRDEIDSNGNYDIFDEIVELLLPRIPDEFIQSVVADKDQYN